MPEHFKKYVNRKINPSYCTDYDKTYSNYTWADDRGFAEAGVQYPEIVRLSFIY